MSTKNKSRQRSRVVRKLYIIRYLLGHPCVECKESDIRVLEFHHRDPRKKKFNISVNHTVSQIKKEIAKCDVLCSNCHKKVHYVPKSFRVTIKDIQDGWSL